MNRSLKIAITSLIFNIVFSIYYLIVSIYTKSWWLLVLGFYYLILSIVRAFILKSKKPQSVVAKFSGIMLMILSIPLVGMVILSVVKDRGFEFHLILMLAIAVYSFSKITFAIISFFKTKKHKTLKDLSLKNISLADAFVSIFALQRSMLATFEGMSAVEIQIMNAVFGSAVCIVVFLLGLFIIKKTSLE